MGLISAQGRIFMKLTLIKFIVSTKQNKSLFQQPRQQLQRVQHYQQPFWQQHQ